MTAIVGVLLRDNLGRLVESRSTKSRTTQLSHCTRSPTALVAGLDEEEEETKIPIVGT